MYFKIKNVDRVKSALKEGLAGFASEIGIL